MTSASTRGSCAGWSTICESDPWKHLEELLPSHLLWFSAGHSASSYGALPTWYPVLSLNKLLLFKKWSLSLIIDICMVTLTFVVLGRRYFENRVSSDVFWGHLTGVLFGLSEPCASSRRLWDLVCIVSSPVCLNKQSHFAEDKSPSAPVVVCNPSGTILSFFRYCICFKKNQYPEGT